MRVRVDVSGPDEIRRALMDADEIVIGRLKTVLKEAQDQVMSLAGPLVPVDPDGGGDLRASLRRGRVTFISARDVISAAIIAGGKPLDAVLAATGHRYNIYAALMELDIGEGSPYAHTTGEAHFIERPVNTVAPSIPAACLAAVRSEDLGGA